MTGAGRYSWLVMRDKDPSYKPTSFNAFPTFRGSDVECFFEHDGFSFKNLSSDRSGITIDLWPEYPSHFIHD